MKQKTILIITDGIGHAPNSKLNAFDDATKPTYDYLLSNAPKALIKTYGASVGLPDGQMGNSEVGHMTLGAGRVLHQDLVKISLSIEDGSINDNLTLNRSFETSDRVHLIGLLSDGGIHSHIKHTISLANIAKNRGKKVFLHLITDGRDVMPKSAEKYVNEILEICSEDVSIASISGRFYTMDRDNNWDRVEKGYRAIAEGDFVTSLNPIEYIKDQYLNDITDEFIEPAVFNNYNGFNKGDCVIFTNFRSDRVRQISKAIGFKDFDSFNRDFREVNVFTMTNYSKEFPFDVIFDKSLPRNTISEVISRAGLRQFHTAETEKYAHVTFFFNGGVEEPFTGEDRVLVDSPNVKTYDLKPEMSAEEVGQAVLAAIEDNYDFIVVNFANGDMVGHTGNYEAAKIAVNAVDRQIGLILDKAKNHNYALVITSDHGNCEEMQDDNGNILTNHSVGDVWCFVIAEGVEDIKDGYGLNNIAPSILNIMGIEAPSDMDEPFI